LKNKYKYVKYFWGEDIIHTL